MSINTRRPKQGYSCARGGENKDNHSEAKEHVR